MTNRYNNGLIYKIVCKDPTITEIYVGSTCNFYRRTAQHKQECMSITHKSYNYYKCKFMRENGGWDNWSMVEIKKFPCETKRELELEERKYIEELKPTLNKNTPTRTNKEWYEANKERLLEVNKKWKEDNKDYIMQQNQVYRDKNKAKIQESIVCGCGKVYTKQNKKRHEKTKKHLDYIQ